MGLFDLFRLTQKDIDEVVKRPTPTLELIMEQEKKKAALNLQAMAQNINPQNINPYANAVNASGGGYVPTTTSAVGINANTAWFSVPMQAQAPYFPSGVSIEIDIVDADGFTHTMKMDTAYINYINEMNFGHRQHIESRPKCLPDPDFDLDDMEKAAELLEGLDGPRPEG